MELILHSLIFARKLHKNSSFVVLLNEKEKAKRDKNEYSPKKFLSHPPFSSSFSLISLTSERGFCRSLTNRKVFAFHAAVDADLATLFRLRSVPFAFLLSPQMLFTGK